MHESLATIVKKVKYTVHEYIYIQVCNKCIPKHSVDLMEILIAVRNLKSIYSIGYWNQFQVRFSSTSHGFLRLVGCNQRRLYIYIYKYRYECKRSLLIIVTDENKPRPDFSGSEPAGLDNKGG